MSDMYPLALNTNVPVPLPSSTVGPLAAPAIGCVPLQPYANLTQLQLAVAAAEAQAQAQAAHVQAQAQAAQAHAHVAALMQWTQLNQQAKESVSEQPASSPIHQGQQWPDTMQDQTGQMLLPPGMTLRLAAAGLCPTVNTDSQGGWESAQAGTQVPSGISATAEPEGIQQQGSSAVDFKKSRSLGTRKEGRDTLRSYLQELRNEDPRCVFIARRINKLGFRSKTLLERHYSEFGEVEKVLVAHSKVKPFRDRETGPMPRTRPGNFGLVVMKNPESVKLILAQGTDQTVAGVRIQVDMFVRLSMDEEAFECEDTFQEQQSLDFAQTQYMQQSSSVNFNYDMANLQECLAGRTAEGTACRGGSADAAGGLSVSEVQAASISAAADAAAMMVIQQQKADDGRDAADSTASGSSISNFEATTVNSHSTGTSAQTNWQRLTSNGASEQNNQNSQRSQGSDGSDKSSGKSNGVKGATEFQVPPSELAATQTMPPANSKQTQGTKDAAAEERQRNRQLANLLSELNHLEVESGRMAALVGSQTMGEQVQVPMMQQMSPPPNATANSPANFNWQLGKSHLASLQAQTTTPPVSMTSELASVLSELGRILQESEQLDTFTKEQSLQAAVLAQYAQQSLRNLEEECQQKVSELAQCSIGMGMPPARPAPGLAPATPVLREGVAAIPLHYPWLTEAVPNVSLMGNAVPPARSQAQAPRLQVNPQDYMKAVSAAQANQFSSTNLPASSFAAMAANFAGAAAAAAGVAIAESTNAAAMNAASCQSKKQATLRRRSSGNEEDAQPRDTLRSHLTELSTEDPECIFIARRINKLGFRSREILRNHYSQFGEVARVLVAHSKVKPFRDSSGQLRTRPGGLGLLVMKKADSVNTILGAGEEQMVAGHQIRVQRFERPKIDAESFGGTAFNNPGTANYNGGSGTSTAPGSNSNSGSRSAGSSSGTPEKSEEISSEPNEKSDSACDVESSDFSQGQEESSQ